MTYRKKLIEVALPLDAINKESAREKSIRHGHPSTLHLWWARRPLAACRAVLFASLIDDPSQHRELFPTEPEQDAERTRLFKLIEEMVKWENSNDEKFMEQVRAEVRKATGNNPPPVLDPFAGGGSIPLEAQRLGLEAHASDLNPVAVLINKALIEIPPKFANLPQVNPDAKKTLLKQEWRGAQGLADDIRYYGKWMRDEAEKRIGHLYPKVKLPKEYGEGEATVIAWLWARTVKCPNPACGAEMPLITSFWLSKKKDKEIWAEPHIDHTTTPPVVKFSILSGQGKPQDPPKVGRGAQFKCLCCENVVTEQYVKEEAKQGRMGAKLIATVAEGKNSRLYLPPEPKQEDVALSAIPLWKPEQEMPKNPRWFSPPVYGMTTYGDIFTSRQLVALTTFSDLLQDVKVQALSDIAQIDNFTRGLAEGVDVNDYVNAVVTYLALVIDRCSDYWSAICSWHAGRDIIRNTFTRQAIPMVWDFAEANPFSDSTGNFLGAVNWVTEVVENASCLTVSGAVQRDATLSINGIPYPIISTDPPYYDNIGYADLSDFFYIWLRRSLNTVYPELFRTMLVPKTQELIATPYRFEGSKQKAQEFFEQGLSQAFERMRAVHHPDYPLTIYYAFKQAEAETGGNDETPTNGKKTQVVASTGWETMLEGLIRSGFTITGTWPMRTEMMNRSVGQGTNALASSIVLVCRPRLADAPSASRRQFINELRYELADALKKMQHGTIAPVDLAQASIGPGMAIYSRYSKVIESDGTPLSIRAALQLINRELDSLLAEQEGEYDVETRWAVAWFEEDAMNEGQYGRAEVLSKAKNASIQSMVEAGILEAKAGKVRLIKREEMSEPWKLEQRVHLTTWEVMQRMIHALDKHGWQGAGNVLAQVPSQYGEAVRDLAYRLYNICERKGWSQEALYYNMLVTSWSDIDDQARSVVNQPQQTAMAFEG
jgi:putative DNA methylase